MALLRACNIPCRIHGFIIDKKLQKGAMTGIVYKNAPQKVFHSWVEVYHDNQWYELEGYILDIMYLRKLQNKNKKCSSVSFRIRIHCCLCNGDEENGRRACTSVHLTTTDQSGMRNAFRLCFTSASYTKADTDLPAHRDPFFYRSESRNVHKILPPADSAR